MIGKLLRHGIGALVGAILGALTAWLAGQGVEVDANRVNELAQLITNAGVLFTTLFGYAAVEKFLKRFSWLDREGWVDRLWLKREAGTDDNVAPRRQSHL